MRSELRITNLGRRDVHSELSCQAANNRRTPPLTATVHVDMNFGPLDVKILSSNQPLSAGRRYDLLCQSSGSRPPASITWWKNGLRLERTKETTSSDGNTTTSTLSLVPKKEDDGKYLTCKAENKIMNIEALEDSWKLEIHYNPEARIVLGTSLNPESIREGTDVYFDCVVNAHPPVYKVEWRHNGNILSINVAAGIIITNQSLVLQGVSRKTAGNYTCVGYNTEGDGESMPFFLNVLYAPTCKPNQPRIYGIAKQERAQIACQVDANPSDLQFRWTFNNSADSVDVAQAHVHRSGTTSIVSYTPVTELDYGTLLCYASNSIGSQRVPCVFHIIAAGRPDQVHNCTLLNISMNSFSIRCAEGFNGGLPQSFLLEVREIQSQQLKSNLTSPVARFTVKEMEPGTQYHAVIFSYNSKGRGEPVILQATTLRLPEKQMTAEKDIHRSGGSAGSSVGEMRFNPTLSVLIGIVSALTIVATIVGLVLRMQCVRKREDYRKRRKEERGASTQGTGEEGRRGSGQFSDKGGGSPTSKHESSTGEYDSDEKNPDIIPQPLGDAEEVTGGSEYRKRQQHISTIETSSPSRSNLMHQPAPGNHVTVPTGTGFMGYCTLRNGVPLHELSAQSKLLPGGGSQILASPYTTCTLPRPQPSPGQWQYGPMSHLRPAVYPAQYRHPPPIRQHQQREPPIALHPIAAALSGAQEEEPSANTPLMANKRESTV
nr:unnamed protein product [Callosobruchus chinensis]